MADTQTVGVSRTVNVYIDDIILGDIDSFNEIVSDKATGSDCALEDISWTVIGHTPDNEVVLRIQGYVERDQFNEIRGLGNSDAEVADEVCCPDCERDLTFDDIQILDEGIIWPCACGYQLKWGDGKWVIPFAK